MTPDEHRKPLGTKGWNCPVSRLPKFKCRACGKTGRASELCAEDDNETLYCPRCGTADWMWK